MPLVYDADQITFAIHCDWHACRKMSAWRYHVDEFPFSKDHSGWEKSNKGYVYCCACAHTAMGKSGLVDRTQAAQWLSFNNHPPATPVGITLLELFTLEAGKGKNKGNFGPNGKG